MRDGVVVSRRFSEARAVSMVSAVRSVGAPVGAISQLLADAAARARVESAWAIDGTVDGRAANGG